MRIIAAEANDFLHSGHGDSLTVTRCGAQPSAVMISHLLSVRSIFQVGLTFMLAVRPHAGDKLMNVTRRHII